MRCMPGTLHSNILAPLVLRDKKNATRPYPPAVARISTVTTASAASLMVSVPWPPIFRVASLTITFELQDDLPVIKENVRKGFVETQSKVNSWISNFRKRIEGDDDDPLNGPPRLEDPPQGRRQNFGSSQSEQMYGIRRSAERSRRSGDMDRYDSDPRVLDDDFAALELRDEEGMS